MAKLDKRLINQDDSDEIEKAEKVVSLSLDFPRRGVCFRGVSDVRYALVPTIQRLGESEYAGRTIKADPLTKDLKLKQREKQLFERFRRSTYEHRGRVLSEWETLFLARHHGLPVRLMDWTSNPLVALYFAAKFEKPSDNKNNGAVYWIRRHYRKEYVDVFSEASPFSIEGIQLVFPFYPSTRMTAPSGLFTIHSPDFWQDLRDQAKTKVRDYNRAGKGRIDIEKGGRWIVLQDAKAKILEDLERFGINDRTLYPDLDGFARGLVHSEVFREPEEYPD